MKLTANCNQLVKHEAEWLDQKVCGQSEKVIVLTIRHLPDENDPAWPSKSGQAD